MRAVIYTASRNLYPCLLPSMRSLNANGDIDKIYLMIEDDDFPDKPDNAEVINVSEGIEYIFPKTGPNAKTPFKPICMMRAATAWFLPEDVTEVLQLDVDTIVCDSLAPLWDIDLTGKWFGAVPEYKGYWKPYGETYYNFGVAMLNIRQIRNDGITQKLVDILNSTFLPFIDQDAWNQLCREKAVTIPWRFNECFATHESKNPAIVHYAGHADWWTNPNVWRGEYLSKWR